MPSYSAAGGASSSDAAAAASSVGAASDSVSLAGSADVVSLLGAGSVTFALCSVGFTIFSGSGVSGDELASCVPAVMEGYKRLIEHGAALPLDEALVREREIATESSKQIASSDIAQRRDAVQSRGRGQNEPR